MDELEHPTGRLPRQEIFRTWLDAILRIQMLLVEWFLPSDRLFRFRHQIECSQSQGHDAGLDGRFGIRRPFRRMRTRQRTLVHGLGINIGIDGT
jgi:hypothetical protein